MRSTRETGAADVYLGQIVVCVVGIDRVSDSTHCWKICVKFNISRVPNDPNLC